jgi:predicted dehydrogenase
MMPKPELERKLGRKLKLAFIGIDHPHGRAYLESLRNLPEVEVVALYTGGRESIAVPEPFASKPLYRSLQEILDKEDFDAAMVLLPNDEAPKACIQLVEAGKHVMAEKPIARNSKEMEPVVEAVRRRGIKFSVGYPWRFHPIAMDIRKFVREADVLGDIYSVEAKMLASLIGEADPSHRDPRHYLFKKSVSGGGFFNWLGIHWLDLLFYFLEDKVTSVTAFVGNVYRKDLDVEDGGVAILGFSKGTIASFHGGYYMQRGYETSFNIHGSAGWIRWDPMGSELQVFSRSPRWRAAPERRFLYAIKSEGGYGGQYGLDMLMDWIASIVEDRSPVNTAENALRVLRVVDAMYESSEKGKRISVSI